MSLLHTILQIVPRLDAGGAERTTLEMVRAIKGAGGRALVVSHGGRLEAEIAAAGGEVFNMPVHAKDPVRILWNAHKLSNLIREEGVSLVHARSRAPAWSALLAARRTGIPFVTTYHGAYRASGPIKRWLNSAMVRADRVIANSRYTGDAIARTRAVGADRLRIIPRGADLDWFAPEEISQDRRGRLASSWAIPSCESDVRVLMPARITPWKGHETAIQALTKAKAAEPSGAGGHLRLVFCGAAQAGREGYLEKLRAEVERCGVSDMAHFVGDCADMPAAYDWADLVIAPSLRPEAFGRTPVEAGAMGKPVIVADHGGAAETVIAGETGVKIAPGDSDALAHAILRLAADPEERRRLGANARDYVSARYTTEKMCADTLGVYRELLE